tara:strand:+ start:341 stop:1195 length:855 start_codon:yes stop_codon:yes gene_type:complete
MFDNTAIIAGSGKLPFKIATYLKKLNSKFIVLSIKGFSNIALYKNFKSYSLRMGEGSKAIKILKENNIKKIIFLGALDRPGLSDLKPDLWTLFKVFKFIFFKKTDDVILRNVARIFENEGFKVIGLSDITQSFFLKEGIYGTKKIPKNDLKIINKLLKKTIHWTTKDLGQSIIASKDQILLKEDRKGTNNLINRSMNRKYSKNSYIFIKIKKLHQDTRIDLPTFGFNTLKKLVKTNIKYIVLNADSTVIMDKQKMLNYLKKSNKTLLSVDIQNLGNNNIIFKYE